MSRRYLELVLSNPAHRHEVSSGVLLIAVLTLASATRRILLVGRKLLERTTAL
jgi:hypothetical protein